MTPDATDLLLNKLADSALALAGQTPWHEVSLSDICAAAEVRLAECAKASVTKIHILAHLDTRMDQAMLDGQAQVDRTQGVRDRLFEVLMSRFDGMEDNRDAWLSILGAQKQDMVAALARSARRTRTAAWALEACGVSASDTRGMGRAIGVARVLRLTEAAWLEDGPDLTKTMARLDQELRKGEEWVERVDGVRAFFGR